MNCNESLADITGGLAKKERFIQVIILNQGLSIITSDYLIASQAAKDLAELIKARYCNEVDAVREKCFAACKRAASLLKSRSDNMFPLFSVKSMNRQGLGSDTIFGRYTAVGFWKAGR